MDNQALRPDVLDLDMSEVVEQEPVTDAVETEDKLAAVGSLPGWEMIAERMTADITGFRTGKTVAIDASTDLATIGQRFVIASTVADHLQAYLDMVNDARRAVVERERANQ